MFKRVTGMKILSSHIRRPFEKRNVRENMRKPSILNTETNL